MNVRARLLVTTVLVGLLCFMVPGAYSSPLASFDPALDCLASLAQSAGECVGSISRLAGQLVH